MKNHSPPLINIIQHRSMNCVLIIEHINSSYHKLVLSGNNLITKQALFMMSLSITSALTLINNALNFNTTSLLISSFLICAFSLSLSLRTIPSVKTYILYLHLQLKLHGKKKMSIIYSKFFLRNLYLCKNLFSIKLY